MIYGFKLKNLLASMDDSEGFIAASGFNFGGGKGGGTIEKPVFVPPPAAPAVAEAATQTLAATPQEEMNRKKLAQKQGAKSLQIPTAAAADSATVGTGM